MGALLAGVFWGVLVFNSQFEIFLLVLIFGELCGLTERFGYFVSWEFQTS
jgi:hypothetical protein